MDSILIMKPSMLDKEYYQRSPPSYTDPTEERTRVTSRMERTVSDTRTFLNLLKGMLGPGCLSLPLAFRFAGLWAGVALTAFIGLLNIHCMAMLVTSAQVLCKRHLKSDLDYGHLAEESVKHGPRIFQKHHRKALYVTNAIVAIYQMGVGSVSFVFLAANLQKVQQSLAPDVIITIRQYQAIWLLPVILACFTRNLKYIAVLSMIGTVIIITGLLVIFQYLVRMPNMYGYIDYWFISFDRFMLFMGAILYSFEGQAMLLPLENEMKTPRDMVRPIGVLHSAMSLVILCYIACGFYGYLKFGNDVQGSITLNMPPQLLYQIANLLLIMVVFVGSPLQFYVIFAMIWPELKSCLPEWVKSSRTILWGSEMLFRTVVILVAFTLAVAVPNLSHIIPLIGITVGCTIALILPPLINTLTMWDYWKIELGTRKRWLLTAKNLSIAAFGIFGVAAGLYADILQMMQDGQLDSRAAVQSMFDGPH